MQSYIKHTIAQMLENVAGEAEKSLNPLGSPNTRKKMINHFLLGAIARDAEVIIFSGEQGEVFLDMSQEYADELDYHLPFPQTILEFSPPIQVEGDKLLGIALNESTYDEKDFQDFAKEKKSPWATITKKTIPDQSILHTAASIYLSGNIEEITWTVNDGKVLFDKTDKSEISIKNLAIACIAYINCENITLERTEPDIQINRKRAAKGKRTIDPFYTCYIRGVSYDSQGRAQKAGTKHTIRYSVRGHIRRLPEKNNLGAQTRARLGQRDLQTKNIQG